MNQILATRLQTQNLTHQIKKTPQELVAFFGAVQSQDYGGAKWALGLRSHHNDKEISAAIDSGEILRTHVMRPTWHFVSPENIRWMLDLTKPAILRLLSYYFKHFGFTEATFTKSNATIINALAGGRQLTRIELANHLDSAGIKYKDSIGLSHLMIRAELDGIICNGKMQGKQFTYALLDERVVPTKALDKDEALQKLVHLYFQSHGLATMQDFVWWSGLTVTDAKKGIAENKRKLHQKVLDGQTYYFTEEVKPNEKTESLFLLPNYDEYTVAYKDRKEIFNNSHIKKLDARANPIFQNSIIYKGSIIGTWKKTIQSKKVEISPNFFQKLSSDEQDLFELACKEYALFLQKDYVIR